MRGADPQTGLEFQVIIQRPLEDWGPDVRSEKRLEATLPWRSTALMREPHLRVAQDPRLKVGVGAVGEVIDVVAGV